MMVKHNINELVLSIFKLYSSDYTRLIHIREVSRRVGVDVKSVYIQLKKLEDMNIFYSVKKGRNKDYGINLDNQLAIYFIIMAEALVSARHVQKYFQLKKIISETKEFYCPIILFGSFAKEKQTEDSDIDLFLITSQKKYKKIIESVGSVIDRDINVEYASRSGFLKRLAANDPLIKEVVESHVLLKGIDEFCELMWRYYAR